MSKWLEGEVHSVEPVINLDLPSPTKDCLISLYASVDGFLPKEKLPKVALVNDTMEFLNDMLAELEAASKENRTVKFLPRGVDESCAMFFDTGGFYDMARAFISQFVEQVVAGGDLRAVFVKYGNGSPKGNDEWDTHCVVYVMKDRADRFVSGEWPTKKGADMFSSICSVSFCMRELSWYIKICNQEYHIDKTAQLWPAQEALEILENYKEAWTEGIPLWLVKQLLDEPEKANKFGKAVESMITGICPTAPVFVDRTESITDKIIETTLKMCAKVGIKDYDIYGAQDEPPLSETANSIMAKSFCFLPRSDTIVEVFADCNERNIQVGFQAVCFIDIGDPNFIYNVIKLGDLFKQMHYNPADGHHKLIYSVRLYSLEEFEEWVNSTFSDDTTISE